MTAIREALEKCSVGHLVFYENKVDKKSMDITGSPQNMAITGVILAGGLSRRMGGEDKGLILWHTRPLYQHVLQRLMSQVTAICINANRNIEVYQKSGVPVIRDTLANFPGPLAGILAALEQAETEWLVFVACDTPNFPHNLVAQLWNKKGEALAVWARTDERDHPTMALLHRSLAAELQNFLARGDRKLRLFLQQAGGHSVLFPGMEAAFRNFNHPEDFL